MGSVRYGRQTKNPQEPGMQQQDRTQKSLVTVANKAGRASQSAAPVRSQPIVLDLEAMRKVAGGVTTDLPKKYW
jgi:hypothetical protein